MAGAEDGLGTDGADDGDAPTQEERLKESVVETTGQAAGKDKDKDEVESDLRSAMLDRGLDPDDTSSLAADIDEAVNRSP